MYEFITLRHAAKQIGICVPTLRSLIKAGQGPVVVRVGRWMRVRPADLDNYIHSHTIAPNGSSGRTSWP